MPPRSPRRPRLGRAAVIGLVAGLLVVAWMASEQCGAQRVAAKIVVQPARP